MVARILREVETTGGISGLKGRLWTKQHYGETTLALTLWLTSKRKHLLWKDDRALTARLQLETGPTHAFACGQTCARRRLEPKLPHSQYNAVL